jgi:hypothetical protein
VSFHFHSDLSAQASSQTGDKALNVSISQQMAETNQDTLITGEITLGSASSTQNIPPRKVLEILIYIPLHILKAPWLEDSCRFGLTPRLNPDFWIYQA